MKIILLNKTCMYHKFDTEIIFGDIPKSNLKFPWAFYWGNKGDSNIQVSLQKYIIATGLEEDSCFIRWDVPGLAG